MICPKCQTDVSSWQFYCPQCRASLQDYQDYGRGSRRQTLERAGGLLINLIVLLLLVGGSVLLARQIDWKELAAMFRDPGARVRTESGSRGRERSAPADRRRAAGSEKGGTAGTARIESVRSMPHRIEELPDDPSMPAASSETASAGQNPSKAAPGDLQPAGSNPEPPQAIELPDEAAKGGEGLITIRCYANARIYVDGQYSGITPRTVRLPSGEHQIRLIADGYEEWTRNVTLRSRQQVGIVASMKRKP